MQLLWKEIAEGDSDVFNGAVEASIALLGAVSAMFAGYLDDGVILRQRTYILTFCALLEASLLVLASQTESLYVSYAAYVLFGMNYHFMITIARYA